MAYENIKIDKKNVTSDGKYFFTFDNTKNILLQKISDGTVAFSYPLLETLTYEVVGLEYDGLYFWTLQRPSETYSITIKKWRIENEFCILKKKYDFVNGTNKRYSSKAFAIESYTSSLSTAISGSVSSISLSKHIDKIEPGDVITIGPNSSGYMEEITVTGTISSSEAGFNTFTEYLYDKDDPVYIHKSMYIFNDYINGVLGGNIMKCKIPSGDITDYYVDNEYSNITACTFAEVTAAEHIGDVFSLLYVKSNTLKLLNVEDMSLYTAMTIDNVRALNSAIIPIHDMVVIGSSVYRLQDHAMYYGTDYIWSTYNYQVSPLRNYVDSITASIYPAILPANGVNTATITAIVNYQYALPLFYALVSCEDDDDGGYIITNPVRTWTNGIAKSTYRAGVVPNSVTIEVTASQDF